MLRRNPTKLSLQRRCLMTEGEDHEKTWFFKVMKNLGIT